MMVRPLITFLGLCVFWQAIVSLLSIPHFILPGPLLVFRELATSPELYLKHGIITATEILSALVIGLLLGFAAGVAIWKSAKVERWIWPLLLVSQAIPVFAIAPLLVVWFGYGMASKITMAVMIVFFPVSVAVVEGLRQIGPYWSQQAVLMRARREKLFWSIQLRQSLPTIAVGARIAAATAPIGAIVGEWVGSSSGLGFLMLHANARMQVSSVFAALFCLVLFTLIVYAGVNILFQKLIYWKN
ncbi:MAG: ABC transporter permease [Methyloligellaceae bacterium]